MKVRKYIRTFDAVAIPGGLPRCHRNREGFTLLELLLASVAALMLLSALYMSFDMTVQQTQAARDASGTEDLTRGVINRLSLDISAVLGPLPPSSGGTASIQASYTNGTGSSTTTTTSTVTATGAAMTTSSSSSSNSSGSSSSNPPLLGSGLDIPFEAGVIGGPNNQLTTLVLFTSRVPDVFTGNGPNSLAQVYSSQGASSSNNTTQYPADLKRVVYWQGANGGLYRQETPWVTGLDTWPLSDLPLPDEAGVCIAKEVETVLFEYYDPVEEGWEQNWDGTGGTSPPYSMTPGPPSAIRITLTFKFNGANGKAPVTTTIQHVFPILSAAGQIPMTLYDPTSGSSSSSGSGGSSSVVGAKVTGAKVTGAQVTPGK